MKKHIRNRYFFLSDIVLLPLSAYSSFVLRLDTFGLGQYQSGFWLFSFLATLCILILFRLWGVYARHWRYASVEELVLLSQAIGIATLFVVALQLSVAMALPEVAAIPRSIPLIFYLLALVATAGPRLIVRLAARHTFRPTLPRQRVPTLIMGAGDAGAMIVRELRQHQHQELDVVGFIDDDTHKLGVHIHGIPVLGNRRDIPRIVQHHDVQQVIIAMPSASGKAIREVVQICEQTEIHTKTIPGIHEILDDKVRVSQLRDVQIEDLLRRAPIRTDITAVQDLICGKRVLITGGGGSIGSEICRQILNCLPAELIIVGHGENSVFEIQNELLKYRGSQANSETPPCRIEAIIADIRFPERIRTVLETYQPEMIFHAAAHKHVPLMEHNPVEAITNNILGTRNLLQACIAAGVERFVMISTDKAVNPTSIMGTSKRVAELLVHHAAMTSGKPYVAVRFGNVLGSRGSVVLTFKKQIAAGGPIMVTHPDMRRYFMTIPEAVQLVLQASTLGQGGEVFTLDMGEPIKIADLARDMIELSGFEVGHDIDIVYGGLRPGEKLFEELFISGEDYRRTQHEKIFTASNASSLVPERLMEHIDALEVAAYRNDLDTMIRILHVLVPQFQLPASEQAPSRAREEAPLRVRAFGS